MEVYAEFFTNPDGNEYRKKTLLHFGNGTKLIGSAVLMNPGSSKPIGEPNSEIINSFYAENHPGENVNMNNWRTFGPDSTMGQLEKVFNGWYIREKKELNGIIQLFNCFYYRNQNLGKAIKNFDKKSIHNFDEYQFLLDKPVYFGWGGAGKFRELKPIATEIFSRYDIITTPIYDPNFDDNCFYHPGYVNRSYLRNAKTQKLMRDFFNILS